MTVNTALLHKPSVSALCPLGILKIVSPGCEGSVESGHPKVRIPYTDQNCSRSLLMMRKALQLCCAQNGHFAWIVVLPAAPSFPSPPAAVPLMTLFLSYPSGNLILASGSVRIPRFMLLESGGLRIAPVFIQDAGNYTCYAANTEGSVNASATLTVWSKDRSLSLCCLCPGGVSTPLDFLTQFKEDDCFYS